MAVNPRDEVSALTPNVALQQSEITPVGLSEACESLRVARQALTETNSALDRCNRDLRDAKNAADAANLAKGYFLATMSHELRTPLVAVIGFAEMLHSELLGPLGNPKYLEYAGDIQHSGEHLLRLINDILDITKAEAGEIEIRELAMNVHDVMTSVVASMAPQAARAEVVLQMAPVNAMLCLRGDSGRVRQILLNLLSNAIKFTKPGGQIQLSAAVAANGDLHLAVNDSGIGIAAEDIPRALAPFGQIDSTLGRKYEGTGIGLPLAQKLLELHGGSLRLESELGAGTEAIAIFPAERVNRRPVATAPASAWSLASANNL